ncbi:hypothetical protein HLB09_02545 [Pseudokineococcus marinus]|uniref:Uncharacterized protein n=1 Tax=Pseudokineococcus marinus TaxID=351215 RepID=A0A849BMZ8_9ACTN|nr:hypothetical protein [Pseudokineococcus marinus]
MTGGPRAWSQAPRRWSRWVPGLLAVAAVVLLVLAVAASPWWAVLGVAAGAAGVGTWTAVRRLDRRRRQLEGVTVA